MTVGVLDRISKGRRSLNASAEQGNRKNGKNMMTCNLILWVVVAPTVLFGCETMVMSDRGEENIMAFQRYSSRRVRRFHQRLPTSSSFYGLGLIKLTSFIHLKNSSFVISILRLEPDNIMEDYFVERCKRFSENKERDSENQWKVLVLIY